MLTEIILESLLNMDDDTLNAVLESCDADELDFIDTVVTEKAYSNTKRVIGNILHGSDATNKKIMAEGRRDEKEAANDQLKQNLRSINDSKDARLDNAAERRKFNRDVVKLNIGDIRAARAAGNRTKEINEYDKLDARLKYRKELNKEIADLKASGAKSNTNIIKQRAAANNDYTNALANIDDANKADANRNSNSVSAKVGDALHQSVTGITKAAMSKHKLGKVTKASKNM